MNDRPITSVNDSIENHYGIEKFHSFIKDLTRLYEVAGDKSVIDALLHYWSSPIITVDTSNIDLESFIKKHRSQR